MPLQQNIEAATELMGLFAERTGLDSGEPARRYLWTDAFAACNCQGLADAGAGARWRELALRTVERVHLELGQFRHDDPRSGWLQGPHGAADAGHPTRCGLRIGKPLPERGRDEPFDERLEWERDGQYFHYLTRWMHALDQLARRHRDPRLHLWAHELADTAHRAFTHSAAGGRKRMHWKMSTDLSRPLVASMGQHDPLDGLITAAALQSSAAGLGDTDGPDLGSACQDYAAMLAGGSLATVDPLGLGGLLMDALRLRQLMREGDPARAPWLERVLEEALLGLRHYRPPHAAPAEARLGFRELGLAIGLAAAEELQRTAHDEPLAGDTGTRSLIVALREYLPLREAINRFWLQPANRRARSWTGHRDINEVMLATSLAPAGWLLRPSVVGDGRAS